MKRILFAAILLFSTMVMADSTLKIQYGVGIDPVKVFNDRLRSINIGYYGNLEKSTSWAITGGWLAESSNALNTGYGCAQFGVELRPLSFMYVDNYFGPCYFHEAHGFISGKLQFATNLGIGWRDKTGSQIGLNWKHFSNAGIKRPNIGLDLVMFNLSFGL